MTQKTSSSKQKIGKTVANKKTTRRLNNIIKPDDMGLVEWQLALRRQAAEREQLAVRVVDERLCPGVYCVSNPKSRQEYKVVYHGAESGWNYCSCMDFKTSQLGTCKHLEAVKCYMEHNHLSPAPFSPEYTSVFLSYRYGREVCIRVGSHVEEFKPLIKQYFDNQGRLRSESYATFDTFLSKAAAIDPHFRCYPDALDYIVSCREDLVRRRVIREKYDDAAIAQLLHTTLYPYQIEGIRFAATAGRAIIADEMGLGKTLQAIGTAQMLRREGFVDSVLVVCPTSLKYQWKREIERFTGCESVVVEGTHATRVGQYAMPQPYKIVSYNSLCNDIKLLQTFSAGMVIMDEVQRLKNWDTQIAKSARLIHASYRVLLSGTPLENKLEELYSIVELADQFCLGPYYQFRNEHIRIDEAGKVVGYANLNTISDRLKSVMIRRRKQEVDLQLPRRIDQNVLVSMTSEQRELHDEYKSQVAQLALRWRRQHFLSEQDRKKMLLFLSMMRMVCDSTFILDQQTRYDTKIDEVMNILDNLFEAGDQKVVVFSQWERMTRLVAQELTRRGIRFEYLHGGVSSRQRKDLVNNFTDIPECKVFLSTDAGSTGLNLQAASVLINLDLPWNPAVLEQRIARIYRIGQHNAVQVINLVSANSFEEEMISRLKFKSSLFQGALDGGEDTIFVSDDKFKGIMSIVSDYVESKSSPMSVAERPEPPRVPSQTATPDADIAESAESNTTDADALVQQGVSFLSGLTKTLSSPEATSQLVDTLVKQDSETGRSVLSIPVPDKHTVQQFLTLLGKMLSAKSEE